ncbi:MAG: hypothetical protein H0V44_01350 [Planctomycetes bacterium]|nr:hypothetical protein [Planctomycetota bacterium]
MKALVATIVGVVLVAIGCAKAWLLATSVFPIAWLVGVYPYDFLVLCACVLEVAIGVMILIPRWRDPGMANALLLGILFGALRISSFPNDDCLCLGAISASAGQPLHDAIIMGLLILPAAWFALSRRRSVSTPAFLPCWNER